MKLNNKKILITGAEGFIGSHLTEELIHRGYDVRAFVLYNFLNSWGWLDHLDPMIKKDLDVFTGDVRDPHGVMTAMTGCHIVFHLAALIGIPYSYHSPDSYVDTNIKGTLNIIQAARALNVEKIIQTSTSEVYGTARFVPITEEHPLQGQSPYSASKIGADHIAMSFYHAFGTPVSIIRPFNTFGPRQSLRAVIPTIITQILKGNNKLKLGAVHPTRDFSYIKDTIPAFIKMAESDRSVGEVINVGSNFEISIKEIVFLIAELMGVHIDIQPDSVRFRPAKSEVERLWADNSKALEIIGWKPSYSSQEGFKRALLETIEWFSKSENVSNYKIDKYNV